MLGVVITVWPSGYQPTRRVGLVTISVVTVAACWWRAIRAYAIGCAPDETVARATLGGPIGGPIRPRPALTRDPSRFLGIAHSRGRRRIPDELIAP
jgi:hypothetical protein